MKKGDLAAEFPSYPYSMINIKEKYSKMCYEVSILHTHQSRCDPERLVL